MGIFSVTSKTALWTIIYHSSQIQFLIAITSSQRVVPFFTTPSGCEAFILSQGLEQHYCSPPLWPCHLAILIPHIIDDGVEAYVLDPPRSSERPITMRHLDDLLDRVDMLT